MNRILVLSIIILVLFGLETFAQQTASVYYKTQAIIDDVESMILSFEEVHPNLYHSISKDEFKTKKNSLLQLLDKDSVEAYDLSIRIMQITALFDEAHTFSDASVNVDEEYKSINIFPFTLVDYSDSTFISKKSLFKDIPINSNDKIISINGISSFELYRNMKSLFGGPEIFSKSLILNYFPYWLHLLKVNSPFNIQYQNLRSPNTEIIAFEGKTAEEINKANEIENIGSDENKNYTFKILNNEFGYINLKQMNEPDSFDVFLKNVFTAVKEIPLKGVIVDMRNNLGGNSDLGVALLDYFNEKPYIMTGGMEWKVSELYKNYLTEAIKNNPNYKSTGEDPDTKKYYSAVNGEVLYLNDTHYYKPKINSLRFKGPVCVLIGSLTFSSGVLTATAIKDFNLTTLIGEPVGESPNFYGDAYIMTLPNTKIRAHTSVKYFIRPNKDRYASEPTQPDILVIQKDTDTERGINTVLEFAKDWIIMKARID